MSNHLVISSGAAEAVPRAIAKYSVERRPLAPPVRPEPRRDGVDHRGDVEDVVVERERPGRLRVEAGLGELAVGLGPQVRGDLLEIAGGRRALPVGLEGLLQLAARADAGYPRTVAPGRSCARHRTTAAHAPVAGLRTRGRGADAPPTGRRFPDVCPVLRDGGRSDSPLRGSPGFAPGSLLPPGPPRGRTGNHQRPGP